jgi:hypothetical protein
MTIAAPAPTQIGAGSGRASPAAASGSSARAGWPPALLEAFTAVLTRGLVSTTAAIVEEVFPQASVDSAVDYVQAGDRHLGLPAGKASDSEFPCFVRWLIVSQRRLSNG